MQVNVEQLKRVNERADAEKSEGESEYIVFSGLVTFISAGDRMEGWHARPSEHCGRLLSRHRAGGAGPRHATARGPEPGRGDCGKAESGIAAPI